MASRIVVIGLPPAASLPPVALLIGSRRQLELVDVPPGARTAGWDGDIDAVLGIIAVEPGMVGVLASGDPGFFGIVRVLAERFGPPALDVRPAVSSVSLAFARLGLPWDDALVVSAHGRRLEQAAAAAERAVVAQAGKAAVLVSPDNPPEALGKELLALGLEAEIAVCSRLGLAGETVTRTDVGGLAAGAWDPLSIVIMLRGDPVAGSARLASGFSLPREGKPVTWGRPEAVFDHRDAMVTKAEVRAVAIGHLELPAEGVLWDVGAGSGSVGIECSLLAPGLAVFAIEQRPDDARRIEANARRLGARVTVVEGVAPAMLAHLPDPDRAFVGGGGPEVLAAVIARTARSHTGRQPERREGRVVATFAALDRAAAAAEQLGQMVQVAASRGERLPDGGWRLAAENPVFVVWGSGASW